MAKQKLPTIVFNEDTVTSFEFVGISSNKMFTHFVLNTVDKTQFVFCIKNRKTDGGEIFIPFIKNIFYGHDDNTAIYFKVKPCGTTLTDEMHPCLIGSKKFIKTIEDGIKAYEVALNSIKGLSKVGSAA